MHKLSICYVAFNYFPGQGLTEIYEFSRKIKEAGHNVYVIAAARQSEKIFEVVDGVKVIKIPVKTTKRKSLETLRFNLLASRVLLKMIVTNHIEIIHVFSYAFAVLIKLATFPSSRRVKWVYDIRSGPLEDRTKSSLIYKLVKILLRLESSLFNKTFVIDEAVKDEVLGHHTKKEIVIVPLGVDFEIFKPYGKNRSLLRGYDIREKDIILVYLGSLGKMRRLEKLIFAFKKACLEVKNLRLMVLGEGDDLQHLKTITKKLLLSDKVFFTGYINFSEVPKYLSAADIGISYVPIIPCFDAQPPIKTVEYLACSLPVIATSTKGNCLFINHKENGFLTKGDPDSLSKAMIRLCRNVNLRQKLAKNARTSIIQYDWRTIVKEKILPAYRKVLDD